MLLGGGLWFAFLAALFMTCFTFEYILRLLMGVCFLVHSRVVVLAVEVSLEAMPRHPCRSIQLQEQVVEKVCRGV